MGNLNVIIIKKNTRGEGGKLILKKLTRGRKVWNILNCLNNPVWGCRNILFLLTVFDLTVEAFLLNCLFSIIQ